MAIKTPAELKALIRATYTDNDTGDILPAAARGFLDDAIDSLVPAHGGSAALDRLQWNSATGWTPVSAVSVQYLVVTAADDFTTLKKALVGLLTMGGNEAAQPAIPAYVTTRFFSLATIGGVNTRGLDALLSDLWPTGDRPPFVWLVTPTAFGWLQRSRVTVSTVVDNRGEGLEVESNVRFGRLPYRVEVDGVPHEIGRYRTSLARPVDASATPNEAALRYELGYASPDPETPTVTQLNP